MMAVFDIVTDRGSSGLTLFVPLDIYISDFNHRQKVEWVYNQSSADEELTIGAEIRRTTAATRKTHHGNFNGNENFPPEKDKCPEEEIDARKKVQVSSKG